MIAEEEKRIWGIHTMDDDLFLKEGIIAIGWKEVGDISAVEPNRDAIRKRYIEVYPDAKKGNVANSVGMLYRFCYEVQIGDYIVFPSKKDRKINIGIIESAYTYVPDAYEYPNPRKVKWLAHFPRTRFSQGALYEVGSALTFFLIKNYTDEYFNILSGGAKKVNVSDESEDESVAATADDIIESTKDFILKELSRRLKGYDLEVFVADLLNAMGYRTTISPHGGDSGIDIVAYKDELPPRIAVQVKSQDSDIKETTIQSLKGAMMPGDYGLFVTLSNYTKNAQRFLNANPIIRGINGSELVELVLKYYEQLRDEHQRIIPLKKVYIPVPKEDIEG